MIDLSGHCCFYMRVLTTYVDLERFLFQYFFDDLLLIVEPRFQILDVELEQIQRIGTFQTTSTATNQLH